MKFEKKVISKIVLLSVVIVVIVMPIMPTLAAEWKPQKTIHLIVPDAPGTPYDGEARIISNELAKLFGTPVVVDNIAGGGMLRGTTAAYRAKPDGYTIAFFSSMALIINQLFQDATYDLTKFVFLGQCTNTALIPTPITTTVGKGLDTWEDVLKLNRPFRWGTVGKGTVSYVSQKAISHAFKFKDPVFITTYSGPEVLPAVVRGECDGAGLPWDLAEPFIKTGQVKVVLSLGKTRIKDFPDVPSVGDLGHPELEKFITNYHIAVAPPGVPKNIETALSNAVYKVVTSDVMKEYQTRAVAKGAVYEALAGDVTRTNVMACLDLINSLTPYLK